MTLPPFQNVVDEWSVPLRRHVVALAGPTDADDLVQETFIAALRAYDGLGPGANVRAWLWTIARNKVIDRHRAAGRRPVTTPLADEAGGSIATAHEPHDADEALWEAVRALPDGQRHAVVLRVVDDLPYAQIAEICGCSAGAARQRVHEGLGALRRAVPHLTQEDDHV